MTGKPIPGAWATLLAGTTLPQPDGETVELRYDVQGQDYVSVRVDSTTGASFPVSRERLKAFLRGHIPLLSLAGNADFCFVTAHPEHGEKILQSTFTVLHRDGSEEEAERIHEAVRRAQESCEETRRNPDHSAVTEALIESWEAETARAMLGWLPHREPQP